MHSRVMMPRKMNREMVMASGLAFFSKAGLYRLNQCSMGSMIRFRTNARQPPRISGRAAFQSRPIHLRTAGKFRMKRTAATSTRMSVQGILCLFMISLHNLWVHCTQSRGASPSGTLSRPLSGCDYTHPG